MERLRGDHKVLLRFLLDPDTDFPTVHRQHEGGPVHKPVVDDKPQRAFCDLRGVGCDDAFRRDALQQFEEAVAAAAHVGREFERSDEESQLKMRDGAERRGANVHWMADNIGL